MRGSQHNDPFVQKENGKLGTLTNNSGGVQVFLECILLIRREEFLMENPSYSE